MEKKENVAVTVCIVMVNERKLGKENETVYRSH
jgi:hypothetical protein